MEKLYNIRMRSANNNEHISGAERLTTYRNIHKIASQMIDRSLHHDRGVPDFISLKIEEIKEPIKRIPPIYQIKTVENKDIKTTLSTIINLLQPLMIDENTINTMYETVLNSENIPGAIFIDVHTGKRITSRAHSVRVSRFDWESRTKTRFIEENPQCRSERILEAMALASKVQAANLVAELCCSDDPNYTTGYLAFNDTYIRIPNMKQINNFNGGRVFLIDQEKQSLEETIHFLQWTPVLIERREDE